MPAEHPCANHDTLGWRCHSWGVSKLSFWRHASRHCLLLETCIGGGAAVSGVALTPLQGRMFCKFFGPLNGWSQDVPDFEKLSRLGMCALTPVEAESCRALQT